MKPLDRLIAKALEAHTAALADYETDKVVFEAHKDAIEGRIKEAAKKPSKGDPASIAKELRTHGEQAPEAPTLRRYKTNESRSWASCCARTPRGCWSCGMSWWA